MLTHVYHGMALSLPSRSVCDTSSLVLSIFSASSLLELIAAAWRWCTTSVEPGGGWFFIGRATPFFHSPAITFPSATNNNSDATNSIWPFRPFVFSSSTTTTPAIRRKDEHPPPASEDLFPSCPIRASIQASLERSRNFKGGGTVGSRYFRRHQASVYRWTGSDAPKRPYNEHQ